MVHSSHNRSTMKFLIIKHVTWRSHQILSFSRSLVSSSSFETSPLNPPFSHGSSFRFPFESEGPRGRSLVGRSPSLRCESCRFNHSPLFRPRRTRKRLAASSCVSDLVKIVLNLVDLTAVLVPPIRQFVKVVRLLSRSCVRSVWRGAVLRGAAGCVRQTILTGQRLLASQRLFQAESYRNTKVQFRRSDSQHWLAFTSSVVGQLIRTVFPILGFSVIHWWLWSFLCCGPSGIFTECTQNLHFLSPFHRLHSGVCWAGTRCCYVQGSLQPCLRGFGFYCLIF